MPRKSASKKQRGGSLASDRVMKNLDTAAATHDYVVSPRIRTKSELGNTNTYKLTGGACGACGGHKHIEGFRGCGATAPTQAGGSSYNMKEKFSNCGTKPTQSGGAHCHKKEEFGSCGGSTAPTQSGGDEKIEGKPEPPVVTQGPVTNKGYGANNSINERPGNNGQNKNGGSRKSIKRRKSKGKKVSKSRKSRKQRGGAKHTPGAPPSEKKNTSQKIEIIGQPGNIKTNNLLNQIPKPKKNNNRKNKNKIPKNKPKNTKPDTKTLKGGGSAWMASQYSLSLADKSHARTPSFSHSKATPKSVLLNPPNMGSAGSGMGDLYSSFAPAQ